ncbi:MAG: hypothetical protein MRY74_04125 [Neomegalonema sp.]|nr:hypothetical protein [Neomegalonema sp.]
MFLSATNAHVLNFDKVSGALSGATSDAMCRISLGGAHSVRALYSNSQETIYKAACPIMVNGIDDMVTRPDLASRSVALRLAAIPPENRRTEEELWAAFDETCPRLLGALLDGVSDRRCIGRRIC